MARERNELFVRAEKFLNENPDKTLSDFRKLEKKTNPNVPLLKTRQRKGQPIRVTYKGRSSVAESNRKIQIEKNRPTQAVFNEAGKLWDELVGKRGKFTMGDKTFTNKQEYQKFEANRHDAITKSKEKLNRLGGKTHGHAVPPKHKFAVETYMQSFPEDASPNYSSQDKLPKDFDKRVKKADIPTTKTEVAKRHVGTSDKITNPIPDSIKEKLLKYFKLNSNGNVNGNGLKLNTGGAAAISVKPPARPLINVQSLSTTALRGLANLNAPIRAVDTLNTMTELATGVNVTQRTLHRARNWDETMKEEQIKFQKRKEEQIKRNEQLKEFASKTFTNVKSNVRSFRDGPLISTM
tara:strand:- start:109 stop:1161 length:1053 start_codon:yes stop_codon:yes gene_type:complete